jgi:hypothetical protein
MASGAGVLLAGSDPFSLSKDFVESPSPLFRIIVRNSACKNSACRKSQAGMGPSLQPLNDLGFLCGGPVTMFPDVRIFTGVTPFPPPKCIYRSFLIEQDLVCASCLREVYLVGPVAE